VPENGLTAPDYPQMPDLNSESLILNRQIGHRGVIQIFEGRLGDHPVLVLGDDTSKVLPILAKNQELVDECKSLNHPNYLRFIGTTQKQGLTLFVHESVPGKPLAAVLKDQPVLPLEDSLQWFLAMVSVVEALHKRGKAHGFLSPSSFLVGSTSAGGPETRSVFLLDYPAEALMKRATCLESRILPFSSMSYSAPEVVRREEIRPESDYFSLGAILARMVTGRFPFGDAFGRPDERVLLSDVLPDLTTDFALPRSLIRLMERLLEKDPERRLANADEIRGWVYAILAEFSQEGKRRRAPLRATVKSVFSLAYGAATLLGLLILVLGTVIIYKTFIQSDTMVSVPNLTGKNFEDAKAVAVSYRLRLEKIAQEFSADYPDNTIVRQDPEPGSRVKASSIIKVTTSKGPLKVRVPDLTGLTVAEARKRLEAAKLALGVEADEDAPPPAGNIVRQSPEAGSEVISGERVNVWVSTGKGAISVIMPDLTGFSVRAVLEALMPLGLELSEVRWKHRPEVNSELVVAQIPEAEIEVPGDTKVIVEAVRPERLRGKATLSIYIRPTENPVRLVIRVTDSRGTRTYEYSVKGGIYSQEIDFLGSATVEAILGDRVIRRETFE
jgi:beta-lactam-binding protein with PASTA domain